MASPRANNAGNTGGPAVIVSIGETRSGSARVSLTKPGLDVKFKFVH
jgi:hypothetical protein